MTPQLVCPGTNLSTSGGTFGFMVASANASMVLDVSRPQRTVFADGAVTLKGRVISCDAQNAKALKGKHFRVSHFEAGATFDNSFFDNSFCFTLTHF